MASTDTPEKASPRRSPMRKSYLWAALFSGLLGAWILSGTLAGGVGTPASSPDTASDGSAQKLFRVRVQTYEARKRKAVLTLRGRTEADARVEVQAETAGVVRAVPVPKGTRVAKDTLLCRLSVGAREAALAEAKAALERTELDYEAAQKLMTRGHTAKLKVAEYKATRDGATAALERARIDLDRTHILAPFDGIVEEQSAKVGDYLTVGETCAKLVSLDPLMVVAAVSEREVSKLATGMTGEAKLVTGETVAGPVHYISPTSDQRTRTFRVELEIANGDGRLRDGVTADIRIPLESKPAHLFSPAVLVLDDEGRVGVRIVGAENMVRFMPVEILADEADGVWVAGLPARTTVIIVGQDYVRAGQKVEPVETAGITRQ